MSLTIGVLRPAVYPVQLRSRTSRDTATLRRYPWSTPVYPLPVLTASMHISEGPGFSFPPTTPSGSTHHAPSRVPVSALSILGKPRGIKHTLRYPLRLHYTMGLAPVILGQCNGLLDATAFLAATPLGRACVIPHATALQRKQCLPPSLPTSPPPSFPIGGPWSSFLCASCPPRTGRTGRSVLGPSNKIS